MWIGVGGGEAGAKGGLGKAGAAETRLWTETQGCEVLGWGQAVEAIYCPFHVARLKGDVL